MTKKNIMPVAVLTLICIIVAALLGLVNYLTADKIQENEEQKVYDSLREVLDGEFKPIERPANAAESVKDMYEVTDKGTGELKGRVVTVTVKGYKSDISITVGVDKDGKITKAVVTSEQESHGKAGMATYTDRFAGKGGSELSDVELFSGATVTSTAMKKAILDAVNAATGGNITAGDSKPSDTTVSMPREESEVLNLAMALVPGAQGFKDVTPDPKSCPETLLKLYEETSGKGYVAYVFTPGAYVPVANEGLIHINSDGDIENINHLTWIVGHGVTAEGFADRFVGKDNWHVGKVELVSGATGTSQDFRTAVQDAVKEVTKITQRTDKKLLELVDEIVPLSSGFELMELSGDAPSAIKRIYKETAGRGYVAFIRTEGWGGAVGTEALVYFDTLGTIKNVKLLIWNVGHNVSGDDYAKSFIGTNKDTVKNIEYLSGATGTSQPLRDAIVAAFDYIPTHFPTARIIGIVILVLSIAAAAAVTVIYKKRRRVK